MPEQVTIKRNKKMLIELAEALESGEYLQGHNHLRYNDEETGKELWCCLGVLCDIWTGGGKAGKGRWREGVTGKVTGLHAPRQDVYEMWFGNDNYIDYPPPAAAYDAGLTFSDVRELAGLNDEVYSFTEIADYIRSVIIGDEEEYDWRRKINRERESNRDTDE